MGGKGVVERSKPEEDPGMEMTKGVESTVEMEDTTEKEGGEWDEKKILEQWI